MSEPLVFGDAFICKRCGHLGTRRSQFAARLGDVQNDAWAVEYCEHCQPDSLLDMLFDAAGMSEFKPSEKGSYQRKDVIAED